MKIYSLLSSSKKVRIGDIKKNLDIIDGVRDSKNAKQFIIDEDWLDSIYLTFKATSEDRKLSRKISPFSSLK